MGLLRTVDDLLFKSQTAKAREGKTAAKDAGLPSKCTVLAIDDDPVFLESIRWLLRDAGYSVLTCTSGAKGLDMLRYAVRDVGAVLLDYNMPKFNGEDTLQYVRQLAPQAKVIGLTGTPFQQLPESFRDGVDKFIQKPCQSGALVAGLSEVLQAAATEDKNWPTNN
jgi:CheY-like chemotaxis protein